MVLGLGWLWKLLKGDRLAKGPQDVHPILRERIKKRNRYGYMDKRITNWNFFIRKEIRMHKRAVFEYLKQNERKSPRERDNTPKACKFILDKNKDLIRALKAVNQQIGGDSNLESEIARWEGITKRFAAWAKVRASREGVEFLEYSVKRVFNKSNADRFFELKRKPMAA